MTGFLQDMRYAVRMLGKNPGFTGIAVTALALGIGLTAVMFSIVYGALMRGLPYDGGDRVMGVVRAQPSRDLDRMGVTVHDYVDWREQQSSFVHLAAYYTGTVNIRGTERAERFDGGFVTANTFTLLGVQPALGRTFLEDEDEPGAPMRVVLGYRVWQDRYDGAGDVVGRPLSVNGEPGEIVGVMPEGFRFPSDQDLWVPLRMNHLELERGTGRTLTVIGKLRTEVTVDRAHAELSGISRRLAADYPETNEGIVPVLMPFTELAIGSEARPLLLTMLGAVSLVLLIACINVANLLLARAAQRTREVGIRTAMGAHRGRVVAQMVAEALALALLGAALGTLIAWVGIDLFDKAVEGTGPPYWLTFELDGPTLFFILVAAVCSAVISGVLPALKATGGDVTSVLKDESRGSSSLRIGKLSRALVIGEIAMSLGLLVAAGLMTKSITTLNNTDFGFRTEDVFTARMGLFETDFPDEASRLRFYEEVLRRVRSIPGVTHAAMGSHLPGKGSLGARIAVEGRTYADEQDYPLARRATASPGYFETFGVSLLMGRDFNTSDGAGDPRVAIVNESFARRHFPERNPLGTRFRIRGPLGQPAVDDSWIEVVGVVPDLWMEGVGNPEGLGSGFYVPLAQDDRSFMSLAARGPADAMELTPQLRSAVASVHQDTPLYWVMTLAESIEENTWTYNVFGTLFMVFGVAALFLASVGLYGVMAFSVSRRTAEVGIRMALGAERGNVLGMILRQGMTQIGIGVVLGLGLAVLLGRGVQLLLFEVSPNDPVVFAVIVAVLVATGLLASLVPARRATRVDPMQALRYE